MVENASLFQAKLKLHVENRQKVRRATVMQPNQQGMLHTKKVSGAAWKEFWAYAGPILTLTGLYFYWRPALAVSTGSNLDPAQSLQTQVVVTNTGHVPIHNIHFACAIYGTDVDVNTLIIKPDNAAPVQTLSAGIPVARNCFDKSSLQGATGLRVTVSYSWPLISLQSSQQAYFSILKSTSGYFLSPDVGPPAGQGALFQFRN